MEGVKCINEAGDVRGKKVFARLDLNVPLENGRVEDTFRIDKVLPTVRYLMERGARVIMASHIGEEPNETLRPVAEYIQAQFPITFIDDIYSDDLKDVVKSMTEGSAILLENLRSAPGETKNDPGFSRYLADLADIYVNDAFPAAHRAHASIVGIPQLIPGFMGLQFKDELEHLSMALNPKRPFLFALGGAKFETKIPLMEKFFDIADHLFIGGALANDFFKLKGYEIGQSLSDDAGVDLRHMLESDKLLLPEDVWVMTEAGEKELRTPGALLSTDKIMDSGPKTVARVGELAKSAALVLWNGPLGEYEKGFDSGTKGLLSALTESGATTIVGGGDTVALVHEMKIADKLNFISTGGGAMLDFLADGELPGIDALEKGPAWNPESTQ